MRRPYARNVSCVAEKTLSAAVPAVPLSSPSGGAALFPMPVRLEDSPIGRGPCEAALRADPPDPGADGDAELRFFMQVKETALSFLLSFFEERPKAASGQRLSHGRGTEGAGVSDSKGGEAVTAGRGFEPYGDRVRSDSHDHEPADEASLRGWHAERFPRVAGRRGQRLHIIPAQLEFPHVAGRRGAGRQSGGTPGSGFSEEPCGTSTCSGARTPRCTAG